MYFISVEQYLELRGLKKPALARLSSYSVVCFPPFLFRYSNDSHAAQFQGIPLCASRRIIVLIVTTLVENSREKKFANCAKLVDLVSKLVEVLCFCSSTHFW